MEPTFESALSSHDSESISVRELDLPSEMMGEMSFSAAMYYLWTGARPSAGERQLLDAMLASLMVHGKTAPAIAARLTAHTEPEATQAAIAAGTLGVGSRFVGTMKECSKELRRVTPTDARGDAGDESEGESTPTPPTDSSTVDDLVTGYRDRGDSFPGIGHPHLHPVDPRAERLFTLAEERDIAGSHVDSIHAIRDTFEDVTDATLPINITGAIAAVGTDMGLSPDALRGVAVISRAAGVTGEVLEEKERPIGGDIWAFIDEHTEAPE